MATNPPTSYCCRGIDTDFYWYGSGLLDLDANIAAAVDALIKCISIDGRTWNPYTRAAARAEFRTRLRRAAQGKLRPPNEVKPLGSAAQERIYEIRWTGITISRIDESGHERGDRVQVRLIRAEPMELPAPCAIGLHAHEKRSYPDPAETKRAQNLEIDVARRLYYEGFPSRWGVPSSGGQQRNWQQLAE